MGRPVGVQISPTAFRKSSRRCLELFCFLALPEPHPTSTNIPRSRERSNRHRALSLPTRIPTAGTPLPTSLASRGGRRDPRGGDLATAPPQNDFPQFQEPGTKQKADLLSQIRFSYATGRGRTDVLRIFSPALEPTQLQWRRVSKVRPNPTVWQWSLCRKESFVHKGATGSCGRFFCRGPDRFAFSPQRTRIFWICGKSQGSNRNSEHQQHASCDNM